MNRQYEEWKAQMKALDADLRARDEMAGLANKIIQLQSEKGAKEEQLIPMDESEGIERVDIESLVKERDEQEKLQKRTEYQINELHKKIRETESQIREMEMTSMKDSNALELQGEMVKSHSQFIDSCQHISREIISAEID